MTANDDGSYTLAADLCQDLAVGDKVIIFGRDNIQALIMVSGMDEADGAVTLTAANADDEDGYYLADFYQFLKVDMECWADASDVDYSDVSEGVTIEDEVVSNSIEDIHVDVPIKGSFCPGIKFESDHFRAEGQLEFSVKGNLLIVYDLKIFGKDYFKIELTTVSTVGLTIDIKAKVENEDRELDTDDGEIKLGKLSIPFSVTGLSAYSNLKLAYNWKLEGGLHFALNDTYTKGFTYNTNDGRNDINKDEHECKLDLEGSLELSLGPKVGIGIDFLSGVVAAEINCFMGGKIKLEAQIVNIVDGGTSRHGCHLCGTGKLMGVIEPAIELKYEITEKLSGTVFKVNLPGVEWTLFSCYLSIVNSADSVHGGKPKFGKGSCPNESWRTAFVITDENGDPISGTVKVEKHTDKGCEVLTPVSSQDYSYLYKGTYATRIDTVKSDIDGKFKVNLPAGNYRLEITANRYLTFFTYATVENGQETYLPISMLINSNNKQMFGGISGQITDATTGYPIEGVDLELREGWDNTDKGSIKAQMTTDENGEYIRNVKTILGVTLGLRAGNYTLIARKNGYVTGHFNVVVNPGEVTDNQNGALNPVTATDAPDDPVTGIGDYRVVLTWGATPSDLDSHLNGLTTNGDREHVFYGSKTGKLSDLDVDDTSSYGPETITITDFSGFTNGFTYSVHDYSNSGCTDDDNCKVMSMSGAVVRLYKGNVLLRTYNVPTDTEGTVWNVFSIDKNGKITAINSFEYISDPYSVGAGYAQ